MGEPVSRDVWEERNKFVDERFVRNKERLDKADIQVDKISALTIQMGEILKLNNEKLDDHGKRIDALESKPSKWFERVVSGLIGAVTTGVGAALVSLVFH